MSDDQIIASKTNLKGQITYVNRDFLEISGFTEQELIGEPHNIVRHPDMPVEAFDDLWANLRANRPWVGYVKNRCKNGDFYWVEAHVAPIVEDGKTVGYLSVRRKPSLEQVSAAENAYRLFREKRAGNLKIAQGKVVKPGISLFKNLSIRAQLIAGFGALTTALIVSLLWGWSLHDKVDQRLSARYRHRPITSQEIAHITHVRKEEPKALASKLEQPEVRPQNEGIVPALEEITYDAAGKLSAQQEYPSTRLQVMLVVALMTLFGALMAWRVLRAVTTPLNAIRSHFNDMAQGNYKTRIEAERHDEFGVVTEALKSMQIKLGFDMEDSRNIAERALRVQIALDNVDTNVMIADNQRNIIYMNRSVSKMLTNAEPDIQKVLPHFKVEGLLGKNIDIFHKNPAHQRDMLAALTQTYQAQIEIGGRTFALAANPVLSDKGVRLGSVVEWQDRTIEVATENEVANIVEGAANGDFTRRIDTRQKEGFFKKLGDNINHLMLTSETGLNDVARVLNAVAQGDLTQNIGKEYQGTFGELKNDTNHTVERLKEVIGQIREAVDSINTASREIAMGNSDLSQRTEEQATSLEETASSMEELTSTVKQNAENAGQANQLAIGASDVAGKGGAVVTQVVSTMNSINDSSRKIVDIISVIDGIAFQTNILALNAAVEAARAGEQGRGFAVVAAEVRNLAQRSAAAAKEIKILIGDSVEKVENGSRLVEQAGQTMEEIVASIKRVTEIMADISAASDEQSAGIEQVNQAIAQMDEVTQQNAALVEEAAAAAESLEEQAQNLSVSVGMFKLGDGSLAQVRPTVKTRPVIPAKSLAEHPVPVNSKSAKSVKTPDVQAGEEDWQEF